MSTAIANRTRTVTPEAAQGKPSLTVFPIMGPSHGEPPYALLEGENLRGVSVTETSPSGSVPELRITNDLDTRVFLMDGQELIGAKQNRILNTDVLVPARSGLTVPVSCVEAGRWRYSSQAFSPGKSASHAIRSGKSERVRDSLSQSGRHDAKQQAVWDEVACSLRQAGAASSTSSLHDAYVRQDENLRKFRGSLRMPDGAVGLAAFRGSEMLGLDLFDRHSTLRYFWESLLDSYAIDWLLVEDKSGAATEAPQGKAVMEALQAAAAGRWESFASPGEGRDYRLNDPTLSGAALVWEERVVLHLQLFLKRATPRR